MYPGKPWDTRHNLDQIVRLTGDYLVTCPLMDVADQLASKRMQDLHRSPVYLYEFNYASEFLPSWLLQRCRGRNICHAMELPYVFHTVRGTLVGTCFYTKHHMLRI